MLIWRGKLSILYNNKQKVHFIHLLLVDERKFFFTMSIVNAATATAVEYHVCGVIFSSFFSAHRLVVYFNRFIISKKIFHIEPLMCIYIYSTFDYFMN